MFDFKSLPRLKKLKINDRLIEKTSELRGFDTDYSACFRCNYTVICLKPNIFFIGPAKVYAATSLRRTLVLQNIHEQ